MVLSRFCRNFQGGKKPKYTFTAKVLLFFFLKSRQYCFVRNLSSACSPGHLESRYSSGVQLALCSVPGKPRASLQIKAGYFRALVWAGPFLARAEAKSCPSRITLCSTAQKYSNRDPGSCVLPYRREKAQK